MIRRLVLAGCVGLFSLPTLAFAQARGTPLPSLARENIAIATTTAKKWKSDAILIQIAGRSIPDDGKILMWEYGFYSPSANKCVVVYAGNTTQSDPQESGGAECKSPEIKEFIDSDKAATVARASGVTRPTMSMAVGVSPTPQGLKAVWIVVDAGGNPGDVTVEIDAQSGAALRKGTQRGVPRR